MWVRGCCEDLSFTQWTLDALCSMSEPKGFNSVQRDAWCNIISIARPILDLAVAEHKVEEAELEAELEV